MLYWPLRATDWKRPKLQGPSERKAQLHPFPRLYTALIGSGSGRPQCVAPRIPAWFNLVLLQRTGPTAFRAETALAIIEVKYDFCSRVKVIGVVRGGEGLCCVVTGRKLHRPLRFHHQLHPLAAQREPAHVGVVSMFLRHDVRDILVRDRTF